MTKLNTTRAHKVRVWDLPTRVFHWLFVLSFITAFVTNGDARYLDTHVFAGYLFATLLLFRIVWGLVGSYYARFVNFRFSLSAAFQYLKSLIAHRPRHFTGHNPAGSIAIYLMLSVSVLVVLSGLIVYGGVEQHGILYPAMSFEQGVAAQPYHELFAWSMLAIVVIHISGVLIESVALRESLVRTMLSGYKYSSWRMRSVPLHGLLASIMMFAVVSAGIVYFIGYLTQTPEQPYLPYQPVSLPQSENWNTECGDCHIPYHPSLLPQRSWITLFKQQDEHFGDDLMLDAETGKDLLRFALHYSAERKLTEASLFINATTPLTEKPLRITKTGYWVKRHSSIDKKYWDNDIVKSRSQCEACHFDAKEGSFEDGAMRLPQIKKKKALKVAIASAPY